MIRWLLSYVLDRALLAGALYLAYLAWGEPLQGPMRQVVSVTDGVTSPFEKIFRALD